MNEETITAAPDLSAVESALVAIESHLVEAESVRASEHSDSISLSVSASESISLSQSIYESDYVEYLVADNSINRGILTTLLFGALAVGCLLGALVYSIFAKKA